MRSALAQSDPIYGSLGPPKYVPEGMDADVALEMSLRDRKAPTYTDDPDHPSTQDSIAWAEKKYGEKMVLPSKEEALETPPPARKSKKNAKKLAKAYTTDEDVVDTLDSISHVEKRDWQNSFYDPNFGRAYTKEEAEKMGLIKSDWWSKAQNTADK